MKTFVITTTSESSDHYVYVVRSKSKPSDKKLEKFLKEHSSDVDEDGTVYEHIDDVHEIDEKDIIEI